MVVNDWMCDLNYGYGPNATSNRRFLVGGWDAISDAFTFLIFIVNVA